ncbi:MAG: hypothetical protein KF801_01670 [Cryobacterium sp.]|nr:hypothetical protein [Cryobacterium sp.]
MAELHHSPSRLCSSAPAASTLSTQSHGQMSRSNQAHLPRARRCHRPPRRASQVWGKLTEEVLAEVGIAPGEVHVVAVFTNRRGLKARINGVDIVGGDGALGQLLGRGDRIPHEKIALVLSAVEDLFPIYAMRDVPTELTMPEPVIPITRQEALISIEEIEEALLANILAKPIEDWMAYLHPDQARLARRSFNGPSRIRGAAGTGKTVVALHRAAYIARTRPGKILVTTYVRTLPDVLSALMHRMTPEVADRVEFKGIFGFALDVLKARGVPKNPIRQSRPSI